MYNAWNLGTAAAVGIGVGVALAASMGAVGYGIGLVGALSVFIASRVMHGRRA